METKTVKIKIQILKIRFLENSKSIFSVSTEKQGGVTVFFLRGKYWVMIRFYSFPNFCWFYQLKMWISSYVHTFLFIFKFIDFYIKFFFGKIDLNFLQYFLTDFRILRKIWIGTHFYGAMRTLSLRGFVKQIQIDQSEIDYFSWAFFKGSPNFENFRVL